MKKRSLFWVSEKNFSVELALTHGENIKCCNMCKFKNAKICKSMCKWNNFLYDDYLSKRGEKSKEKTIDYVTEHKYYYRIAYHKVGFFLWEWDIMVRKSEKEDDYLGLTFGEKRALFPKRKMAHILVGYAENKDAQNLKLGVNLNSYRVL